MAVSGGMDSVVLLDLMDTLSPERNWRLEVAHYHHGIRGCAADEDATFVEKLAADRGLTFYRGSLPPMPENSGENWEAYARSHRYDFLEKCCEKVGLDWIVTAHHADDQAETIFMRLLHGTGVQGLQGIREKVGRVVRPLLPFRREEISSYAQENELVFQHDSSNDDIALERNFLRHEVLAKLDSRFSDYQSDIRTLTENIRELEEFVQLEMEERADKLVTYGSERVLCLNAAQLLAEPAFIRKRLIHHITDGGDWRGHVWRSLDTFLRSSETGQMLTLPNGWSFLKDREDFLLTKTVDVKSDHDRLNFKTGDVSVHVEDHLFELEMLDKSASFLTNKSEEIIDIASIPSSNLELRRWRPGDRMKPLGMGGSKKVSDILIDCKQDRFAKARQFVLTSGGEIVWLCGICLDDRFKVTERTSRFGRLVWRKEGAVCAN